MSRSLKFKLLTGFLLLFIAPVALCCINEYRALLNGRVIFTDALNVAPQGRFSEQDKIFLLGKLHEADSLYQVSGQLQDYSDYAAMLVYNGRYLEAKQIFQSIEQKAPARYQTAANLGTVYELLGQNDSALYWIKKAVAINPDSHEGSEWIHVKILEAKISAKTNEKYLWENSILSLDFGNSEIPANKNNMDLGNLGAQLYEQLVERMSFIKPKEPIVAQLLFDLGNTYAITKDVKSALQVYEVAKQYGYSSELLEKRESYFKKLQLGSDIRNNAEQFADKNPTTTLLIIAAIFIAFVALLILIITRIIKSRQAK